MPKKREKAPTSRHLSSTTSIGKNRKVPKTQRLYFPDLKKKKDWRTGTRRYTLKEIQTKQDKRSPTRDIQDRLVSVKAFIDKVKTIDEYERNQNWLDEDFAHISEMKWKHGFEEVSEILYKWGRFLLDHSKYEEGLLRFWEIYDKFVGTRWHAPVFEELVAREQPEDMVFIEGGLVSFDKANQDEEEHLEPYFLDIHPVVNVQYMEFIKATGYPAPQYWSGDMYPIGKGNHPVVWISSEDAMAYAFWRGKRLASEVEWEKAARGPDKYLWPWGNQYEPRRCNSRETGIGDTSPIEQYTNGKSPYNCYDMAGNVWEWTDSWYDGNKTTKVLRGGSWFTFADFTSATYRNFDVPTSRSGLYGFRCAKSFGRNQLVE